MSDPTDSEQFDDFAQLLADHQGRLYGFIRSLMGSDWHVEEVLQNTCQVLWEKSDTFQPGSNFQAWAFQTARYQVLQYRDQLRKDGIAVPFTDEMMETLAIRATEKESAYDRRRRYLKLCLDKMPARQREVIEKRYFERLSVQSISDALAIKPNAVSQLLFRGRENLLRCIESQIPGDTDLKTEDHF